MLQLKYTVLLVRGVVEREQKKVRLSETVEEINYLNSIQLQTAILESELVVCRSGYSSLMDLVTMNKKALLIPTAGQTEQEYVAHYLGEKGLFTWSSQDEIDLERDVERAFSAVPSSLQFEELKEDYLGTFLENC